MKHRLWVLGLGLALGANLPAADTEMAEAFATAATKLSGEKARNMYYKALVHDENCPLALIELGKLFEQDGNPVQAGNFYVRAVHELDKNASPQNASLRNDAERRARALNPLASRLRETLTDYAQELAGITKKVPDALTTEEAYQRSQSLRFEAWVPPEKLPKFEKPAPKVTSTAESSPPIDPRDPRSAFIRRFEKPPEVNNVPLEVERTLKTSGWDRVKGTWKKVGNNIYEVTDGRLEADKKDGAVSVLVHKSGAGTVGVYVRNKERTSDGFEMFGGWAPGYGVSIKDTECSVYVPFGMGNETDPYKDHSLTLPENQAKNQVLVQITGTKLEIQVNGKKEKNTNYRSQDGCFALIVKGSATIELPQAGGR